MKVYCPNNKEHKCWSDDKFCTSCGNRLLRDSVKCKACNRQQFPALGVNDRDIIYCAYCGSNNLEVITEDN